MNFRNPFESFRMRNVLGVRPPGQPQPNSPTFGRGFLNPSSQRDMMMPNRQSVDPYLDEMTRLQTEVGPSAQAYRQHLQSMPDREDYRPGWGTRIAAALSGFGAGYRDPGKGVEVAQGINSSNYNNALSDYANRGAGLQEQARIEQDELDSKLKALQNARAMGLKYDEFRLKQLQAEREFGLKQQDADTNRMRAEAYAENQRRPGFDAHAQADGSVLYVNKADPTIRHVVPANTVAAANLRVNQGRLANDVRRTNIYGQSVDNAHRRGQEALNIQRQNANGGGQILSPREQQDAEDTALRQMLTDPTFSDYIELDDDGFPTLVDAPDPSSASEEELQDYQDFIDSLNERVAQIIKGNPARPRLRGGQ